MKLEINETHKKAKFNKLTNLRKKFSIPFLGAVISITLFSGCSNNELNTVIEPINESYSNSDINDDFKNRNLGQNIENLFINLTSVSVEDYANEKNIPINHMLQAAHYFGIDLPGNDYKLSIDDRKLFETELDYSIQLDEFASKRNISENKLLQFCKIWGINVTSGTDRLNGIQIAVIRLRENYSIQLDEFASKQNISVNELLQLCEELNIDGYTTGTDRLSGIDTAIISAKIDEQYEQLNEDIILSGKSR